jgi:hypothetical protein
MDKKNDILPAWFTERMMGDVWSFGLLMRDGTIIGIQSIESVKQAKDGSIWLDVRLMESSDSTVAWLKKFDKTFVAPTSRIEASINASYVMAAFELADT